MNRSQTRKFRSLAKKKGISHSLAEMYISMRNRGSAPQDLHEGDLVRLNVEQIMKHPDYLRLSERYMIQKLYRRITKLENELQSLKEG